MRIAMFKKLLVVLVVVMAATVQGVSQDFRMPKITKVLEVLSKNLNVRSQPSVQSPKLNCESPEFLFVIDETPEWYHTVVNVYDKVAERDFSTTGYVSKKVCRTREAKIMDMAYLNNSLEALCVDVDVRKTGKYSGLWVISYTSDYGSDPFESLFIGKPCGNYFVGEEITYQYREKEGSEDYEYQVLLDWDNEKDDFITMSIEHLWNSSLGEMEWKKLTDSEITKILAYGQPGMLLPAFVEKSYRHGDSNKGYAVKFYPFYADKYEGEIVGENKNDNLFKRSSAQEEKSEPVANMPNYPEFKHPKFAIEAPNIDRVVRITADEVNIRKQPSAQSSKLCKLYDLTEECLDCPPEVIWATNISKSKGEAASALKDETYPLVGESGDWYEVFLASVYGTPLNTTAYIMKKFCKVEKVKPLTLPAPKNKNVVMINSGKYAGLCLESSLNIWDGQDLELHIGKYSNGMFIFHYSIPYYESEDNITRLNEASLSIAKSLIRSNIDYENIEHTLDLQKFSSDPRILDLLLNNLDRMCESCGIIYYGVEGDNSWNFMDIPDMNKLPNKFKPTVKPSVGQIL